VKKIAMVSRPGPRARPVQTGRREARGRIAAFPDRSGRLQGRFRETPRAG